MRILQITATTQSNYSVSDEQNQNYDAKYLKIWQIYQNIVYCNIIFNGILTLLPSILIAFSKAFIKISKDLTKLSKYFLLS